MAVVSSQSDWQRRYDQSLVEERETIDRVDNGSDVEAAAAGMSGWLPGWIGVAGLGLVVAFGLLRRLAHRIR